MKRRKPPYVLGGILFAAFCGVIFMGIRFAKNEGDPDQPPPPPPSRPEGATLGTSRQAPPPSKIVDVVNSDKPRGTAAAPEDRPAGPATVLNPNHVAHKPAWDSTHPGRIGSGTAPDTDQGGAASMKK